MIRAVALLALLAWAGVAAATPEDDADRAFHAALAAGDIDALERLGAAEPTTRWTDDAWLEAARIAIRANDVARARRDLERAIATSSDPLLARRARAELARLTATAGAAGEWSRVATDHERLVRALNEGGDPRPPLAELAALVRAHPDYPRRVPAMLALALAWEREGEGDTALGWLREARRVASQPLDTLRAHAELVRTLIRLRELASAEHELAALVARGAPRSLAAELRARIDRAAWRQRVRWGMWGVVALLGVSAVVALRRASESWRGALRRLVRPPSETVFLIPIAAILVIAAYTGNPLAARAVRTIVIAGVVASWISGAILAGRRVSLVRALAHAVLVVIVVAAVTYLAVDDGHLIDFLLETWRAGHEIG